MMHYLAYVRRYVPSGASILDVAGGAGIRYLAQHWHVAGLEVSRLHAEAMAQHYELAMCADALRVPLTDNSVDLLGAAHAIYQSRWLSHAYNLGLTVFGDAVERLLPLDRARYLLAVCQKRESG